MDDADGPRSSPRPPTSPAASEAGTGLFLLALGLGLFGLLALSDGTAWLVWLVSGGVLVFLGASFLWGSLHP